MPLILQWDPIYTVENGKRLVDLSYYFSQSKNIKKSNFEMYQLLKNYFLYENIKYTQDCLNFVFQFHCFMGLSVCYPGGKANVTLSFPVRDHQCYNVYTDHPCYNIYADHQCNNIYIRTISLIIDIRTISLIIGIRTISLIIGIRTISVIIYIYGPSVL